MRCEVQFKSCACFKKLCFQFCDFVNNFLRDFINFCSNWTFCNEKIHLLLILGTKFIVVHGVIFSHKSTIFHSNCNVSTFIYLVSLIVFRMSQKVPENIRTMLISHSRPFVLVIRESNRVFGLLCIFIMFNIYNIK